MSPIRRPTRTGLPSASPEEQPYLARLERDGWADELETVCHHVEALADHPGWQALTRLINEAHEDAFTKVLHGHSGAQGRVLEQAEYARLHGFFAGLGEYRAAQRAFQVADARRKERNRQAAEQRA